MGKEIERKFLVSGDFRPDVRKSVRIVQGYLNSDPERTVRVRIRDDKAYLTVKGQGSSDGLSRYEWEKEIPCADASELLCLCEKGVIDKTRHLADFAGHTFEVDEFHGANDGLVVAELELPEEDSAYERPSWLGEEVTGQPQYYNSMLASRPYKEWMK